MNNHLRHILILAALLATVSPVAAGEISSTGSSIEVENFKCEVASPYAIKCKNIGRVCEQARNKEKAFDDYYLGCALDEWKKKHPKEACPENRYRAPQECMPMVFN